MISKIIAILILYLAGALMFTVLCGDENTSFLSNFGNANLLLLIAALMVGFMWLIRWAIITLF